MSEFKECGEYSEQERRVFITKYSNLTNNQLDELSGEVVERIFYLVYWHVMRQYARHMDVKRYYFNNEEMKKIFK